jgi:hypothetical protein
LTVKIIFKRVHQTCKFGDLTAVEKDVVLTSRLQRVEDDVQRWKQKAATEELLYIDTVPYLEIGFSRPEALFRAQRAGLRVELDLFTEIEIAFVIPNYTDFPVGAKAELEISYVTQGRIDDVLAHLIKADRGTAQLDLHRVIEVLTEVRELENERLEGILERAYVRTANLPGENDQTVIAKMDTKRQDRLRPQRSTRWRREELAMRTLVDAQKKNSSGQVCRWDELGMTRRREAAPPQRAPMEREGHPPNPEIASYHHTRMMPVWGRLPDGDYVKRSVDRGHRIPLKRRFNKQQLGSNRPSPEQGILVVWAFIF